MSTIQQLGIDRMTIAERIVLAQEILDSIAAEQPRLTLSDAKRQELSMRLAEHEANPEEGVTWEGVEAAARARFRGESVVSRNASTENSGQPG